MDRNYLVTKSNYFIKNSSYDLSLEEQKLILTLASMVQPTDEEFKPYNFRIADFMDLLGVADKSKYTQIPKITKDLMKKVFEIREGNKIIQTAWISGVIYEKGSGMVTLKFNPDLKPYMLQLKENFTQYQLANVLMMRSKYSPRIYEILKCDEFKRQGYTEVEIDELRRLLKAESIYPLYADFKRFIILQAQKELKALTDISFDFEEIKTGRKVTGIKFIIKTNRKAIDEVYDTQEGKSTLEEEKRSKTILDAIKGIFKENISELDAKKIFDAAKGDINIVKEKYRLAQTVSKIDNIVGWMISAIKEDYKAPISKTKTSHFNNFEQRQYNFEELERRLLGWE